MGVEQTTNKSVKYEKIRESEYGDSPNNVHITRRGDTISIEPTYPSISTCGVKFIEVNQESVRASDGIRITYDYDRDGWSIMQPTRLSWSCDDEVCDEGWTETAFVESWHFRDKQKEWDDAP